MNNRERRELTKTGILDAAARCFAINGYDGTGVAEICKESGVSKGAFYYHFESKENAFICLIERWLDNLQSAFKTIYLEDNNIPDMLIKMSSMMNAFIKSGNTDSALFLELWVQATRNEKIRKATIAPYKIFRESFTEIIKRGIAEGSLRETDPETAAQAILSMASGMFLQEILNPGEKNWDKNSEGSINIILEGIQKK